MVSEVSKKEKKQSSSGIFSKMKALLGGKKTEQSDENGYQEEKEILRKYKNVLQEEENTKKHQSLKEDKVSVPKVDAKKDSVIVNEKKNIEQTTEEKKEKFKQSWKAPTILKTNLAKGEQTVYVDWNTKIKKLLFMGTLSCFFIVVVYIGLIVWGINTKSKGKILASDIEHLKSQILSSVDEVEKIDDFHKKLKNVNLLLDRHIYWSNVFAFVEKNTFKNVQITGGLGGSPQSEYTFPVITDNFTTLNQQVRYLRELDEVIDAQFEGGSFQRVLNEERESVVLLGSNIRIRLKPEIFFKINE